MFTIQLNNLKFFAHHGVHEEEKVLGGEFEVNALIEFAADGKITKLNETIDYSKIFELIKQRMQQPTALLETVAQDLVYDIYKTNNGITSVDINIKKLNPPISNFQGSVGVSYKHHF